MIRINCIKANIHLLRQTYITVIRKLTIIAPYIRIFTHTKLDTLILQSKHSVNDCNQHLKHAYPYDQYPLFIGLQIQEH
ncbi:hypothetical protein SAMN02745181_0005 [Rubritalea squalenifaciens DSM 18772]|uniref:Uncharacterized protein n=1 Tax=Rubritalea squalenifaciens DSM 18772 TaxID=1123071 RepID=A0A1M6SW77_9BACT|nr:hypothetical protein SAMN02745181_0005 [Rubritalea squalenifaciens DSM 18772]